MGHVFVCLHSITLDLHGKMNTGVGQKIGCDLV